MEREIALWTYEPEIDGVWLAYDGKVATVTSEGDMTLRLDGVPVGYFETAFDAMTAGEGLLGYRPPPKKFRRRRCWTRTTNLFD